MVSFIDQHKEEYGVEPMCSVLPIAPGTYYEHARRKREPERRPLRQKRDDELRREIGRVYEDNHLSSRPHTARVKRILPPSRTGPSRTRSAARRNSRESRRASMRKRDPGARSEASTTGAPAPHPTGEQPSSPSELRFELGDSRERGVSFLLRRPSLGVPPA
jgi:hypothetical protein